MLLNILWIAPSRMCLPIYWTYFSLCTNTATSCKLDKTCFSNTCFGLNKLVGLDTITGCITSRFDKLYCVFSMALPFRHLCRQVNIQMTECRIFVFCTFCQFNKCAVGCWSQALTHGQNWNIFCFGTGPWQKCKLYINSINLVNCISISLN